MNDEILIKNGSVINFNRTFKADIVTSDGIISRVAKKIPTREFKGKVIDAENKFVLPAGIDPHVHMSLKSGEYYSSDSFASGSIAALSGGTATFIDFVTPSRGEDLTDAFKSRLEETQNCKCDFSFHMSITSNHTGIEDQIKKCINKLGIFSFKLYMAYKNSIGMSGKDILCVMKIIGKHGGIATVHCENGDAEDFLIDKLVKENRIKISNYVESRPPEIESEAVNRILLFSKLTGCPVYLVHVSSDESLGLILKYRERGSRVIAETCPHYLLFDKSLYNKKKSEAARFLMSPPLRAESSIEALWEAVSNGLVEVISTDHCPFHGKGVDMKFPDDFTIIPKGVGGVEYRLRLLWSEGVLKNRITLNRFVNLVSTRPAKIFGLFPKKGIIKKGADADLVIWDPDFEERISIGKQFQNCDSNIYDGMVIRGAPGTVLKGGSIVFDKGLFDISSPPGKFIERFR